MLFFHREFIVKDFRYYSNEYFVIGIFIFQSNTFIIGIPINNCHHEGNVDGWKSC